MTPRETWHRVFATRTEAEAYLRERGFSVGHMQADQPRGVMLGRYDIRKWRDLSAGDRMQLHGLVSTMESGSTLVTIYGTAPAEVHDAIRQSDTVPVCTKPMWLVTESSYGKVTGRRQFPHREEADKTADVWRRQSAGAVTVGRCEVTA